MGSIVCSMCWFLVGWFFVMVCGYIFLVVVSWCWWSFGCFWWGGVVVGSLSEVYP